MLSQGEILARNFRDEGWQVGESSTVLNPLLRAADMTFSFWRERKNIDLVIVSCYSGRAFRFTELAARLCRGAGLPLIAVLHGGALPDFFAAEPERAKKALGSAAALVAPSPFLAHAAEQLGLEAKIIPNVVAVEKYLGLPRAEPDREAPRLLWMRTFHEIYHPELALEALARLRSEGHRARPCTLTMAGQDKGLLETCRRRAAELGIADMVAFPGFLDLSAKIAAFSRHDVLRQHPTGSINTPVTARSRRRRPADRRPPPSAACRTCSADGEEALLVPPEDPQALRKEAIRRLLADDSLRRRIATGGHRAAAASSWPEVDARWQQLFQATGRPSPPPPSQRNPPCRPAKTPGGSPAAARPAAGAAPGAGRRGLLVLVGGAGAADHQGGDQLAQRPELSPAGPRTRPARARAKGKRPLPR